MILAHAQGVLESIAFAGPVALVPLALLIFVRSERRREEREPPAAETDLDST